MSYSDIPITPKQVDCSHPPNQAVRVESAAMIVCGRCWATLRTDEVGARWRFDDPETPEGLRKSAAYEHTHESEI